MLCEAVNPLIKQSAEIIYTLCSTRIKTNFRRKIIISYLVCHMEKYHVIVHEADKADGKKRQFVEIYYNCFGVIPNPA